MSKEALSAIVATLLTLIFVVSIGMFRQAEAPTQEDEIKEFTFREWSPPTHPEVLCVVALRNISDTEKDFDLSCVTRRIPILPK